MKVEFRTISDIAFSDKQHNILGEGTFASVKLIYHKDHPEQLFALKLIKKYSEDENSYIKNETKVH